MFFHYLTLSFIKNITVLSSAKMLFWKHSIRRFDCYFERNTFDSITNSGKLVQKLYSEQVFFENIKRESNSRFLSIISEFSYGNKNEDWFLKKKQRKYSSPWKQKVLKRLFWVIWAHLTFNSIFRRPTMVGALLGIRHSLSNFCHGFLINQVGMPVFSGIAD